MLKRHVLLALALLACGSRPRTDAISHGLALAASERPRCARAVTEFGAIPNDGGDDRAAIQAWLNACAGTLATLPAGTWDVVTPPAPRPIAMLTVPAGTSLEGAALDVTVRFSGDNSRRDWTGFAPTGDGVSVMHLSLVTSFAAGTTVEQTHVVRVTGPVHGFRLSHFACDHLPVGGKSGDCVQFVGYSPDRLVYDVEVDHGTFLRTGRSGIAMHSGIRGMLVDGHMTSRFHDNVFISISDQDIDGEGSGDVVGLEIDHNDHQMPEAPESAIAVQIQGATGVWLHDNVFHGRGLDLYGCDACRVDHNVINQAMPGVAAVTLRKAGSGTSFSDERYSRTVESGSLPLLQVSHKISAPRDVTVRDSVMSHHAGAAMSFVGIQGVTINDVVVTYDGAAKASDAVTVLGSGQAGGVLCDGVSGIRATNVRVSDLRAKGPYRAVVGTSGSYCGAGALLIRRTRSSEAAQGLRCENVTTGAGVTGPVVLEENDLPGNVCPGF